MADALNAAAGTAESPAQFNTPAKVVSRWLMELDLADKAEKEWRLTAQNALTRYRLDDKTYRSNGKRKGTSFNILWANTDTLTGACYNSPPKPDVRRRFRDKDPIGKAVAEVVERELSYSIDAYDFDGAMTYAVKDFLLPGRAVVRVRYSADTSSGQVADESVGCEHVQWDDFRHGPGKTWAGVPWIAYRHKMDRDMLVETFGEEIGKAVPLDQDALQETEKQTQRDDTNADLFKHAVVWEFWDRTAKNVLWISPGHKSAPLREDGDPLGLRDFFDCPQPLLSIWSTDTLVPVTEYSQYESQANELDRVSERINKITGMCKVRGIFDAVMGDLERSLTKDDGEMEPAQNLAALYAQGGTLDKAIWFFPVERVVEVLKTLIEAREQFKKTIYEITGISDLMRASTDPNETKGAQVLKSQWGTLRIQQRQKAVAKYARDLLRLMGEIICSRFQQQTLAEQTDLKFMTMAEKQMAQFAMQPRPMAMGMPAQPPQLPPDVVELMKKPTWDEILQVMRSPKMAAYRVDIETDSTIAADIQQDQRNITELLGGITSFITAIGPAVQTGMFPIQTAKTLMLSAVRRFKLGNDVEDAIEDIPEEAPQGGPPTADPKAQAQAMAVQQKAQQSQQELAQQAQQHAVETQQNAQLEQLRAQMHERELQQQAALDQQRMAFEAQMERERQAHERQLEAMRAAAEMQNNREDRQIEHMRLRAEAERTQAMDDDDGR